MFPSFSSYYKPIEQSQIVTQIVEESESSQTSSQASESSQTGLLNPSSQVDHQLLSRQKSDEFNRIKKSGNYSYLQQQLCNTDSFEHTEEKSFNREIPTPFGPVNVNFKNCQNGERYVRYVNNGGTYKEVSNFLNKRIKDTDKVKEIFEIILEYMTFNIQKANSLENNLENCINSIRERHRGLLKYLIEEDQARKLKIKTKTKYNTKYNTRRYNTRRYKTIYKTKPYKRTSSFKGGLMKYLARLCAFVTFCDPCFGKGETGGAEIRSAFRIACNSEKCDFSFFTDEKSYPFGQKGAFKTVRDHNAGIKINPNLSYINTNLSSIHETTELTEPSEPVKTAETAENDDFGISVIEPSGN